MKRGSTAGIAFLIFLLALLGASLYFLYLNISAEPIEFEATNFEGDNGEDFLQYSSSKQFYENMRFSSNEISYRIEDECDINKKLDATEAFANLNKLTILNFFPAVNNPDITILCGEIPPEQQEDERYFVAGEGGPTEVINTSLYSVIFSGKVSFFREEKCNEPIIATHEILHVLGFDHNSNPNSVLYPTLNCNQKIDQEIINDINNLYSVKSAPDLKIEDVQATKTGSYLDFEVEVINQGLKDAKDVRLTLYYGDQIAKFDKKDFLEFGEIPIGTKKILTVTNAKISRSSDQVRFVVDDENKIEELFENNNMIRLGLAN